MERFIPITKDILFDTSVAEVRSISIEHKIEKQTDYSFRGDINISGDYKLTRQSDVQKQFSHVIPVDIEALEDYDLRNAVIDIDDFNYNILDNNAIRVNIVLSISGLEQVREYQVSDTITDEVGNKLDEVVNKEDESLYAVNRNMLGDDMSDYELNKLKSNANYEILDEYEDDVRDDEDDEAVVMSYFDEEVEEIMDDEEVLAVLEEEEEAEVEVAKVNGAVGEKLKYNEEYVIKAEEMSKKVFELFEHDIKSVKDKNVKKGEKYMRNGDAQVMGSEAVGKTVNFFEMMNNSEFENFATYCVHVVQPADTVDTIMAAFDVPYQKLAEYNDLTNIEVGDKLIIPAKPKNA